MAIKSPQFDLPSGFRGGADAWDSDAAGTVAATDYFEPVDVSQLSLSAWYRTDYAGSPWGPTDSYGKSLANGSMTEATFAPTVGTSLNGHPTAAFNGTTRVLANANALTSFISATAWSIALLIKPATTAATRSVGAGYSDPAIVSETYGGYWYVTYTTSGVTVGHYDSVAGTWLEANQACSANAWHSVYAWFDGVNIGISVDGSAPSITASTDQGLSGAGVLTFGASFGGTYYSGLLAEVMVAKTTEIRTYQGLVESYFQARYFVASGAIAGSTAFTLGQSGTIGATAKLTGSTPIAMGQSAVIVGKASIAGSTPITIAQSGSASAVASVAGSAPFTLGQSGAVSAVATLAGSSAFTFTQSGTVTAKALLAGSAAIVFGQSGTITGSTGASLISGTAGIALGQSGTASASASITGSSAITVAQSGSVVATARLTGSSAFTLGQSGAIGARVPISGSAPIAMGQAGTVSASASVAGSAPISFDVSGDIDAVAQIAGSSGFIVLATGALSSGSVVIIPYYVRVGVTAPDTRHDVVVSTPSAALSVVVAPTIESISVTTDR